MATEYKHSVIILNRWLILNKPLGILSTCTLQSRLVGNAKDLVEEGPLKILSSIKAMQTLAKMV